MAAIVGQVQAAPGQAGAKTDMAPILQQLNLASLRTRTQDLHNAISRILSSFHNLPTLKWSEVLAQFAMVNVELLNLVEDIKPILKAFVVYPKNVNAENSTILPIMLSSKLLPEMEAEEAIMKEQILSGISNLPVHMQSDKIQRQIELVRSVCDAAEKVLQEARKVYGLSNRQGPVALTTLDKAQAARITEQEKLIRAASNSGDGGASNTNRSATSSSVLPPHLAAALGTSGTDGGLGFQRTLSSALPPSGLIRPAVPQQTNPSQLLARSNLASPMQALAGAGTLPGVGGAAPSIPYVNSPRSGTGNFNVPSPQQHQQQGLQQQQQQQQQQQAALLRQQKIQQLQKQAQVQQNQQLRRPGTPPIPQGQASGQQQGQVTQAQLLQIQQQQQAKLQETQLQQLQQHQLQQHYQAQQDKHSLQLQQQQTLQQQIQSTQLQAAQQNALSQVNQGRTQLNQLASNMNPLYGNTQSPLLPSNVMRSMTQPGQSQAALIQQRYLQGSLPGNLQGSLQGNASQLYMGNMGMAGTGAQASSTLALPLQQQLAGQANYSGLFNTNQNNPFGQQRHQPPPQ